MAQVQSFLFNSHLLEKKPVSSPTFVSYKTFLITAILKAAICGCKKYFYKTFKILFYLIKILGDFSKTLLTKNNSAINYYYNLSKLVLLSAINKITNWNNHLVGR